MLLTKLHKPGIDSGVIKRNRLFEQLNAGITKKLILISAPAGFGKSTAVADWINENELNTAWFSIDKNDNDMVEFISYLIYAIQNCMIDFGVEILKQLQSPNHPKAESLISLIINDLSKINQDILLVLDDFHLIKNPEITDAIQFLIEYSPQNLHTVMITRSDPALAIAKLRSRQHLVEIRAKDLSFSNHEIAQLFNKHFKLKLDEEDIATLKIKTEGWIAGLQLAAISLQNKSDLSAFIKDFAGNNRYIMDYLLEEVLNNLNSEVSDFLLQTSILKEFNAQVCNDLLETENGQSIIESLESNNLFIIPLDEERIWYRYHHLFADLLKQRLQAKYPNEIHRLHQKACIWYEQNELYDRAIDHAFASHDYPKVLDILSHEVEKLWQKGRCEAILTYGEQLPEEQVFAHPEFCIFYAWVHISDGKLSEAEKLLSNANDAIQKWKEADEKTQILKGKLAVAHTYLYSHYESPEKVLQYQKIAENNLPQNALLWQGWLWFSLGAAQFSMGQLVEAGKYFERAYNYATQIDNIFLISTIEIRMAENEQLQGKYFLAARRCTQLLNLIEQKGLSGLTTSDPYFGALYFIKGSSLFTQGDFEEAYQNIEIAYLLSRKSKDIYQNILPLMVYTFLLKELNRPEANEKIKEADELIKNKDLPPYVLSMYIGWKHYLLAEEGKYEEALHSMDALGISFSSEITYANETLFLVYSRINLYLQKYDEAEKLLLKIAKDATDGHRIERIIEVNIQLAAIYHRTHQEDKAIQYLIKAMEPAVNENLLSFFLYNQLLIADLLTLTFQHLATHQSTIPKQFIDNLKRALEKKRTTITQKTENELSEREIETLKLIAAGMSNQEIADKLFISLNTVKTHLKNINLKLESSNRNQAVEKAKELRLI